MEPKWQDGSLFNNMFYMKVIELSTSLGEELPYIALPARSRRTSTAFEPGWTADRAADGQGPSLFASKSFQIEADLAQLAKNTKLLDSNMNKAPKLI